MICLFGGMCGEFIYSVIVPHVRCNIFFQFIRFVQGLIRNSRNYLGINQIFIRFS